MTRPIWLSQTPVGSAFKVQCHYRLTTLWQGEGLSLDIVNDGTNTTPLLAKTGNFSGQLWKVSPVGPCP